MGVRPGTVHEPSSAIRLLALDISASLFLMWQCENENLNIMIEERVSSRGFTLVELLVTVAVLSILLAVAVPSFQSFLANNRMASQANDLITALNLARSEAIRRSANVTVCASSTGTTCTGGWAQGWIVRDAGGTPIRVQRALGGSSTLTGGTDVASTITYTSSGRTTIATGATSTSTTLTLCPPASSGAQGRAIQIERTGRVRVTAVSCP